jgi:hypothetical protein
MATITLKYNSRNHLAKRTEDYILSPGVFETQTGGNDPHGRKTGLDEALEDVENGRVHKAKDADDVIRQCLDLN